MQKQKKFDQAGCKHGSTIFQNDRRHTVESISLLNVDTGEDI